MNHSILHKLALLAFFVSLSYTYSYSQACVIVEITKLNDPTEEVDLNNLNISIPTVADRRLTGTFTISIQADDINNPGVAAAVGSRIPVTIIDDNGSMIANVDLVVGETTTSNYVNDYMGAWASKIAPYLEKDTITGSDLLSGTVQLKFAKYLWAVDHQHAYTDGVLDDTTGDYISGASILDWKVGETTVAMKRVVDLIIPVCGRDINSSYIQYGSHRDYSPLLYTAIEHHSNINGNITTALDFPLFQATSYAIGARMQSVGNRTFSDSTYIKFNNDMECSYVEGALSIDLGGFSGTSGGLNYSVNIEDDAPGAFTWKPTYRDNNGWSPDPVDTVFYDFELLSLFQLTPTGGGTLHFPPQFSVSGLSIGKRYDGQVLGIEKTSRRRTESNFEFELNYAY